MKLTSEKRTCKGFPTCFIPYLFCLLFFCSCQLFHSRARRPDSLKEERAKTDFFQNVTSRYNILHNAHMMLENERKAVYLTSNKNYQVRLSVFDEPTVSGDPHRAMDSLIQKAYKVVNTKQESKYVHDAYFVIGRAYYFKGSYYTASAFFDKLIHEHRPGQNSFKALAYAWKSRALLQLGKVEAAGYAIDSACMFPDSHAQTKTFVNAAKANYLVRIGEEQQAILFLREALSTNKKATDRYRWKFLLAQLYRDTNKQEAYKLFAKLSKSNIPFDMAFEAELQSAFLTDVQDTANVVLRTKPFLKMLKEGKNSGYRDQILFEIGKTYLAGGDECNALRYFNKSLSHVDRNPYQQTETFLLIADHFFSKKQYQKAQLYYDSTATALPENYTDVNKLRRKLAFMSELNALYQENLWQDSLIMLGRMADDVRDHLLDSLGRRSLAQRERNIAQQKDGIEGSSQKSATYANTVNSAVSLAQNIDQPGSIFSDSRFYFNNQDARLLGASEFKKKWGNRPLKDDWRFAGDFAVQHIATPSGFTDSNVWLETAERPDTESYLQQYRQRYLGAMPITKDNFADRHQRIHDNMIAIANIYRDYMRNSSLAIQAYEDILGRFPDTKAAPDIYYALFRIYDGIDQGKSLAYKNRLIALYPASVHAMAAKDPYYMEKINRDQRRLDLAFERLFALYINGDHVAVIKQATEDLKEAFGERKMAAQIAYLKALAIGRVGRVDDFIASLDHIIATYPEDSLVMPLARANKAFIQEHPEMFANRVNALQDKDNLRIAFVDEPDMTPWPALHINGDYRTARAIAPLEKNKDSAKEPTTREEELLQKRERAMVHIDAADAPSNLKTIKEPTNVSTLTHRALDVGQVKIDIGPNEYRDKKLFPDTATYYFAINVMNPSVNLAPSRYGVGQFNRSRYARAPISHQLNLVNAENQLLCIGPFETFEEVKTYETRILPLLPEIMKVPQEDYNSFIITREAIGTLTDGIQISNYHQVYKEQ